MTDRKPKWAWSSVDDPNPHYPTCGRCDAFARWAFAEYDQPITSPGSWITAGFACGRHLSTVLDASPEEELMVFNITVPPERS